MPLLEPRLWTATEVEALPEDPTHRVECVDGLLVVTPTPRLVHQSAVTVLAMTLEALLRPTGAGAVFVAPSAWALDPLTLVQPDLYVVPLIDGRRPRTDDERGDPLLFVEVLSPSTARVDRVVKRERYQRAGIEYWIIDLDSRVIERWLPGEDRPVIEAERIAWRPRDASAVLEVVLGPFFRDVLGDS